MNSPNYVNNCNYDGAYNVLTKVTTIMTLTLINITNFQTLGSIQNKNPGENSDEYDLRWLWLCALCWLALLAPAAVVVRGPRRPRPLHRRRRQVGLVQRRLRGGCWRWCGSLRLLLPRRPVYCRWATAGLST